MEKRGRKPGGKVKLRWSGNFAYAIGLLATDGCLSRNGRTVIMTSREDELIQNFLKALGIQATVGNNISGTGKLSKRVQIGDVLFYRFLLEVGLTPAKSRTLAALRIPDKFFFDFLRGVFDGDGSAYSYFDPRWPTSLVCYVQFASASKGFIDWLRSSILRLISIRGHITQAQGRSIIQLKYGKREGLLLARRMYSTRSGLHLSRKHLKVHKMLAIVGGQL